MRIFLFLLAVTSHLILRGAPTLPSLNQKENLASRWMIYQNNRYEPFESGEGQISTIYFWLDGDKYAGDYLAISTSQDCSIFINGQLASRTGGYFKIDSLTKTFSMSNLLIGIHQTVIKKENLITDVVSPIIGAEVKAESGEKPPTFFEDFVVISALILLIMLIVVMRLNPKLASDYFSVTKIFSLRESDDSQIYTRISSSTNILFYFFCSLILGFYLVVVFHFISKDYSLTNYFLTSSFSSTLFKWIEVSMIILAVFFLKIILIYSFSMIFLSKQLAGIHFFNWVRLLLVFFGVVSIILFTYFVLRGQSPIFHAILLKFMLLCLLGWVILIFLKLNGRTGYSMFHLFSYICATEIIPLLIIITVLYN